MVARPELKPEVDVRGDSRAAITRVLVASMRSRVSRLAQVSGNVGRDCVAHMRIDVGRKRLADA